VAQNKEQEDIGLTFEYHLETYLFKKLWECSKKIKLSRRLNTISVKIRDTLIIYQVNQFDVF
jgi:uncharacterized protein YbcC (UPF0753/DUF2309 family)